MSQYSPPRWESTNPAGTSSKTGEDYLSHGLNLDTGCLVMFGEHESRFIHKEPSVALPIHISPDPPTYLPYETVPLLLPPKENLDYRIEALMKLTPQAAVQIKPRSRRRLSRISIYTVSGCRKTLKGTTTEWVCKLGMNKAAVQASCENNNKKNIQKADKEPT